MEEKAATSSLICHATYQRWYKFEKANTLAARTLEKDSGTTEFVK
jgi:hypothetical protein